MLQLLSDLILADRVDFEDDGSTSVSGYQGSWVTFDSNHQLQLTDASKTHAWPVWNEQSGAGPGYAPDVVESKKISVLTGHHRANTDQYGGTISLDDRLVTASTGILRASGNAGDGKVIAVCTRAARSVTIKGTAYTMIEYETV